MCTSIQPRPTPFNNSINYIGLCVVTLPIGFFTVTAIICKIIRGFFIYIFGNAEKVKEFHAEIIPFATKALLCLAIIFLVLYTFLPRQSRTRRTHIV